MRKATRSVPWRAVRAVCSAAALFWVLRVTPLQTIIAALRQADWLYLLAGMILNLLTRFAAAERTRVISRALGLFVSRWQTIETLFISNFYALLSPGPVLSGVVSIYRYRNYGASITGSVGSLLASRVIELAAFIALGSHPEFPCQFSLTNSSSRFRMSIRGANFLFQPKSRRRLEI